MKKFNLFISVLIFSSNTFASCLTGYYEMIIQIMPDAFYEEISWSLKDSQGNTIAAADSSEGDTLCLDTSLCYLFTITDNFGDGIFSPGGYWLYLDGNLIGTGNAFGSSEQHTLNCNPGMHCTSPEMISTGTFTAAYDDTWYLFSPPSTGNFTITTCSLNTCNTKIWVYSGCQAYPYNEGVPGTFAYNDDYNCGTQAVLNTVLIAGNDYYIRIGDNLNACTSSVNFSLTYNGPVTGCTDILACNYNPLATVNDSSCMYAPNPLCAGPDLEIDSLEFVQSLIVQTTNASNCDVAEGCVTGYGTRYVISFTSRINNLGTLDFFVGDENLQPGMFNTFNCHGHAHYEGYGDYRLFDSNGNIVPAGHKNGYCVMDLCGFGQYTCGNMGITAGCYDEYSIGTQCQWIDITNVPTGDYRLAVIINSKHLPDAFGHYETNYINNALQICIHITQNTSGPPTFTLLPSCSPYVDCVGIPGGNAELDCNGICNGPSVYGDVFPNNVLDSQDVHTYLDIIQSTLPASNCNDLNRDSALTVYDAALVNWCNRQNPLHPAGSVHNHCNFPRNITNPNELTGLQISNVNFNQNYLDIEILNPGSNISAYQFRMHGITISSVVSLASPIDFPVDARFISSTGDVFAISLQDSMLERSNVPQPLVRIYFNAITDTIICIDSILEIINQNAERTVTNIFGTCYTSVITSIPVTSHQNEIVLFPNPVTEKAFIHFPDAGISRDDIIIFDVSGKRYLLPIKFINESWYELDTRELPEGLFILRINYNSGMISRRFLVVKNRY